MLTLLSPAKKQQFTAQNSTQYCAHMFPKETQTLIQALQKLNTQSIKTLMRISDDLAKLNHTRFAAFNPDYNRAKAHAPAVLAFQGDAYRSLQAETFSEKERIFCQENLAILSGLYGMLRPYDAIQPYRLEMKTKLQTGSHQDLYSFWGDKLAHTLNMRLSTHKHPVIINLASNEYSKAALTQALEHPVIHIDFKERNQDGYRTIGIHAKKARGAMARFIIQNALETPDTLRTFNDSNYAFNMQYSSENTYVFTRDTH